MIVSTLAFWIQLVEDLIVINIWIIWWFTVVWSASLLASIAKIIWMVTSIETSQSQAKDKNLAEARENILS